jgi:hypothetical protein
MKRDSNTILITGSSSLINLANPVGEHGEVANLTM